VSLPYRECFYRSQDDLRLYYRDYGEPVADKPALLCLTGLTRNSRDFDHLARRHAGERRVICPDYRGRGRSQYDPNWRNYRPETHLQDIRHLLAATNTHKVVAVGTSFGGILSMALGVLEPTVLAGVILNDVGPEVVSGGLDRILDYIGRDRPEPDWPKAVASMKRLFPALSLETEEDWRTMAEGTFRRGEDGLLHFDWDVALARPLMETRDKLPDLWPLYRSLRPFPVLAVRGGVSDVLSAACLERMAIEKPDLRHLTVPGVGHPPTLDEAVCRDAITSFLSAI
jgi:pimeloyl-ACP methyl ester carboxylesterase